MNAKRFSFFSILILAAVILSACVPGIPASGGPNLVHTQAVQTVIAAFTQTAAPTQNVLQPTTTTYPTATLAPSATPLPTLTPFPTATAVPPTPTSIPLPCNRAEFVKDVSVADGAVFGYADKFTKTWRVKNTGSCTWTNTYELVFRSGSQMGADDRISLAGSVRPGETVDISVNLVAPKEEGTFTGYWALESDTGQIFGTGFDASQAMWVKIKVENVLLFNYTKNLCANDWATDAGVLPCPSNDQNPEIGYFKVVDAPVLEGGYIDDEAALVMVPPVGDTTYIEFRTDEFEVDSQHFRAVIGCLDGARNCNVKFTLDYQIVGQPAKGIAAWVETYDNKTTAIDIDLSFLKGEEIRLVLTVMSNGSNGSLNSGEGQNPNDHNNPVADDLAFWLFPALYK